MFLQPLQGDPARCILDCGVSGAAVSPDGKQIAFNRGRASLMRKGYQGPQALQLWLANLDSQGGSAFDLRRVDKDRPNFQNISHAAPFWGAGTDGQPELYFVSDPDGVFNVWRHDTSGGAPERITNLAAIDGRDDGAMYPSMTADGSMLVFRRGFDLYRCAVETGEVSHIPLSAWGDTIAPNVERVTANSAGEIAFTEDGKQMAFVASDDIWIMDRILKEPVRVTATPDREGELVFTKDGKSLLFVSEAGGEIDVWEASYEVADGEKDDGIWFVGKTFELKQITDDPDPESSLALSPNGEKLAWVKGQSVQVANPDGTDLQTVVDLWSTPTIDWSPDGKWLVYASQDDDYNSDIWVVPIDRSREPFNLSQHPDRDTSPKWSPDGKRIAFVGRRDGDESDVYWVNLVASAEEETSRDRKLKEALEAMKKKGGKGKGKSKGKGDDKKADGDESAEDGDAEDDDEKGDDAEEDKKEDDDKVADVEIDFDGIFDRMHRISMPNSFEGGLIWSPDGEKLMFRGQLKGESVFASVTFPDEMKPKKLSGDALSSASFTKDGKQIVGLSSGKPASMNPKNGSIDKFEFTVRTTKDWGALREVALDQAWRAMRDRFYDPAMNNRDWNEIRARYRAAAADCLGNDEFTELANMLLGELNASHMGHRGGSDPLPNMDRDGRWRPQTMHLGLRFGPSDGNAPGMLVESVIPKSPCSQKRSLVEAGETLLEVDGEKIVRGVSLDGLLTMAQPRDLRLLVRGADGAERKVVVRPLRSVAGLLYDEWVEGNRASIHELSKGKLGYLHIRGMNMQSFRDFETDLYHAGSGKDGIIIDVRFNGGGSTTDHVLTALTQPVHAMTMSRGSGVGYPQDRKVYASWSKPIVLMCNEHSFSNAEILSHAVKQLGRGRLVGMRTAGGVISTGGVRLVDGSMVRMPGRGWYLVSTGEDMELNGCEPDVALWNHPMGPDVQLQRAAETLAEDVARAKPMPELLPAAAKRRKPAGNTAPAGASSEPAGVGSSRER